MQLVFPHSERALGASTSLVAIGLWGYAGASSTVAHRYGSTGFSFSDTTYVGILVWLLVLVALLLMLAWILFGTRALQINNDLIEVQLRIFGHIIYKSRHIEVAADARLKVEKYQMKFGGKSEMRYQIVLRDLGREIKLISKLSRKQCLSIQDGPHKALFDFAD